jgi:hypothetical protein
MYSVLYYLSKTILVQAANLFLLMQSDPHLNTSQFNFSPLSVSLMYVCARASTCAFASFSHKLTDAVKVKHNIATDPPPSGTHLASTILLSAASGVNDAHG